jgi:alkylmercury lyase
MSEILVTDPDRILEALNAFPETFLILSQDEQRVSLAIYRLLGVGEPVPLAAIAVASDVAEERVHELLETWPGVYLDSEGRVIGYWGLGISETNHRIELAGSTVYGWCAWDVLFIPALLGQAAEITSHSPVTGEAIRLTVSPNGVIGTDGKDVYVSFLKPDEDEVSADLVGSFCQYVFFFTSLKEGEGWTAAHPDTYLLTLDQAFGLGRLKNARQYPDMLREEST